MSGEKVRRFIAPRTYEIGSRRRGDPPARRRAMSSPRLMVIVVLLGVWSVLVVARLFDLQILQRSDSLERARKQQERTVQVEAHRGRILDRTGRVLSESIDVPSLYAHPGAIPDAKRAARQLAPLVGRKTSKLTRLLGSDRSFVWLARRVSPATAEGVLNLGLGGVGKITESRRYYPKGRLGSHVLGFVGDEHGLGGIEYQYDEVVSGAPGKMMSVRDGRGSNLLVYLEHPSSSGQDLTLTLDEVIQYHAEVELDRAMKKTRSRWGTVVVMHPGSGAVLAMATRPSFNPNSYQRFRTRHRRNRAVTDSYEPGSTFKVVVAAAALEHDLVHPDEVIDCGNGSVRVHGRRIRDHKKFDRLTFTDVLAQSSNVGSIRVGGRLHARDLYDTILAFGFGARTGLGLPGESAGILHPPEKWSGISQASLSIGQELTVTPLQMLRALAAVPNGGILPQPYILQDTGGVVPAGGGRGRRVIGERTAETLNRMLEWAVNGGTGKRASVPGYQVAGKTGTAQKATADGGYGDEHVASFAGYVPSRGAAIAMIVVLDSPKGAYHGGEVAAPVFARVAVPVLQYLQVPPDDGATTVARASYLKPATSAVTGIEPPLAPLPPSGDDPVVPALSGSSLPRALSLLARAGLTADIRGTGQVVSQYPPAGRVATAGSTVRIRLARRAALR